jgi:hypothetical protein
METPFVYSYLKQTKCLFFKNREQEGKTGPAGGWYQWERGGYKARNGCGR